MRVKGPVALVQGLRGCWALAPVLTILQAELGGGSHWVHKTRKRGTHTPSL